MIRFSIITITWNAAHCIQRTLDSVGGQTYQQLEHMIIDGVSTDATLQMVDAYRQQCPYPVIVSSEPDSGIYDAMNKGLKRATGDYVIFMNAGDCFPQDDTLEQVVRRCRLSEYPSDGLPGVLYGLTDIVDGEGRYLRPRRLQPPAQLHWRSFRHGMLVCHQAFYVRLDIAREFPYNLKYRHSADVDWCIRIMKEAERRELALVNAHVIVANFEEGGDTTQHHRDSLMERFNVMAEHYGYIQTVLLHGWFVVRAVFKR